MTKRKYPGPKPFKYVRTDKLHVSADWWTNGLMLARHEVACDIVRPILSVVKNHNLELMLHPKISPTWVEEPFPNTGALLGLVLNYQKSSLVWLDYIIESKVDGVITRMRPCTVCNDVCYFPSSLVDPVRAIEKPVTWNYYSNDTTTPLRRRRGYAVATHWDKTLVAVIASVETNQLFLDIKRN